MRKKTPHQSSEKTADRPGADSPSVEEVVGRLDRLWAERPPEVPGPFASLAGTQVGSYTIERVIGRGGFGIVYKARDRQLNRHVALKTPRPEVLLDDEKLRRFETEARAAACLDHPAIVPLLEADVTGATPYIASAYCPGPNLQQWLEAGQTDESRQPGTGSARIAGLEAARFVTTLADAVQYAHSQGVLHRDLKPGNILLMPVAASGKGRESRPIADRTGTDNVDPKQPPDPVGNADSLDNYQPRLTDFGLARFAGNALETTHSSMLLGTPLYMSPEQAECRSDDVSPPTDVFALGAILYHLLTGTPPFAADSYPAVLTRLREEVPSPIRTFRTDIGEDLDVICRKCLQKSPEDRYQSAAELADDLRRYQNGEAISARPLGLLNRLHRWSRQPSRIGEAIVAVIIISCVRICTSLIGLLLLLRVLGEVPPTQSELLEAVLACVFVTTPADLWVIRAAFQNQRRKLSEGLYRATFLLLLLWTFFCLLIAVGLLSGPLWYQRTPGARTIVFSLIGILFATQVACWHIADWKRVVGRAATSLRRTFKISAITVPTLLFVVAVSVNQFSQQEDSSGLTGPSESIVLDGQDDYMTIADVGFAEGMPLTLEAWIQPADTRRGTIVQYSPLTVGTVAAVDGNRIEIQAWTSASRTYLLHSTAMIPVNHWVHVAAVYNGRTIALYVNGLPQQYTVSVFDADADVSVESGDTLPEQELPTPFVLTDLWPGSDVFLGANNPSHYPFAGRIGEVRFSRSVFYHGAFTPATTLSVGSDTVFLFHFGEEVGDEILDATGRHLGKIHR